MRDCDHACTKPAAQLGQPSSQPLEGQEVCFSIWAPDPWAPQRRSFRCWNQQPWSLRGVVQLAKSPSRASWLETKWPRVCADQVGLSLLASAFPLLTSEAARNPNAACKRGRGRLFAILYHVTAEWCRKFVPLYGGGALTISPMMPAPCFSDAAHLSSLCSLLSSLLSS